jgi:hypothetical protein
MAKTKAPILLAAAAVGAYFVFKKSGNGNETTVDSSKEEDLVKLLGEIQEMKSPGESIRLTNLPDGTEIETVSSGYSNVDGAEWYALEAGDGEIVLTRTAPLDLQRGEPAYIEFIENSVQQYGAPVHPAGSEFVITEDVFAITFPGGAESYPVRVAWTRRIPDDAAQPASGLQGQAASTGLQAQSQS